MRGTALPPLYTAKIFFRSRSTEMSASGSPSTTIRSACLPASSVPISSCNPSTIALLRVAQTMASMGERPTLFTYINISSALAPMGDLGSLR